VQRRAGHCQSHAADTSFPFSGYISRSVAGSYDNEAIAIFLLMITFYLWIKALKDGSALWGTVCALFYFYMVAAWGGYVFITNLIPLHVFALLCMGRYSNRAYVAYSSWYAVGTLASMQVPFVGFQPMRSSEHMAALGESKQSLKGGAVAKEGYRAQNRWRREPDLLLSAPLALLTRPLSQASSACCSSSPLPSSCARTFRLGSSRCSSLASS